MPARTATPRWYDVVLTTVYASHFLTGAGHRGRALAAQPGASGWCGSAATSTLSYAALVGYIVFPMAPPWMAARDGYLPAVGPDLQPRLVHELGIERTTIVFGGLANKIAAMPSLHAGIAFLVAFYGIWRLRSAVALAARCSTPLAMSLALVYFAEHYVLDVLIGGVVAALVMVGCSRGGSGGSDVSGTSPSRRR